MSKSRFILYLFSGSHSGAKIALTEGIHVIGSDESCDIILSEQNYLAKRHASLEIVVDDEHIEVFVQSLDGKVIVNNEDIGSSKVGLANSQAFYFDKACFAWNYLDAEQEFIIANYASNNNSLTNASDLNNNIGSQNQESSAMQESFADNLQLEPVETKTEPAQASFWTKAIKYIVLICLLSALTIYLKEEPESNHNYLNNFKLELENAGLSGLNIQYGERAGKENIEIRGVLYSETQRTKLQELARDLQHPVYIYVEVKEDIKSAIISSFNAIGLFPSISFDENSSSLTINAYMKDFLVEEAAFSNLYTDVAEISKIKNMNRNIIYAENLALELMTSLSPLQINNLSVLYNTGQIVISGNFMQKDIDALNKMMQDISAKLNIPITYILRQDIVQTKENKAPTAEVSKKKGIQNTLASLVGEKTLIEQSEKTQSSVPSFANDKVLADALGGLRISSVTTKPIPFATTVDGQKLFEGTKLPNDYIIESISTTSLTLRKGDHVTTIKLGNSN